MLRSHRISSSTTEKLWSIGLKIRTDPTNRHKICALLSRSKTRHGLVSRLHHCRSFTSGTTGLIIKEQPTTTISSSENPPVVDKEGNVLGSAAKEAQRLSDLAAKCRPEKDKKEAAKTWLEPSTLTWDNVRKRDVDEATIQNALEAAQALLFVTRLSSPLQDAIQNRQTADPAIQKQVSSLHRAFLAVTSWCLDVVTVSNQPDSRMLDVGLQVAHRAHQLQLPFHMPLYIRLMNVVAEHYHHQTKIGVLILEIAGRATTMLGPAAIESSQIFREPLEALVRRRCFRDVAVVVRGIESQYSMMELDKGTLLRLLVALEVTVKEDEDTTDWEETGDVLEILNLADPYLWKTITALESLSDIWNKKENKKRERMEQIRRNLREAQAESTTEKLLPTLPSHMADEARRVRRKRATDSYKKKDDLYLFRAWIYQESPTRHDALPDITAQIEALYDGKDFRYSEELERSILKRQMRDDDDDEVNQMNDDLAMYSEDYDDEFYSDEDDDFYDLDEEDDDDDDDDTDDDSDIDGSD